MALLSSMEDNDSIVSKTMMLRFSHSHCWCDIDIVLDCYYIVYSFVSAGCVLEEV